MGKIVLISPSAFSGKYAKAIVAALKDMDFIVRQAFEKAAKECWEVPKEGNLLPVTELNCVVLTQISEPEFRLVLYERGTVTQ